MPRYYFDVTDAGRLATDHFGILLASDDEARDEALGLMSVLARDMFPDTDQHEMVVSARNGAGAVVYEASFALNGKWWPGKR